MKQKNNILLIEGCDKVGKSSLIRRLKIMYPSAYVIKNQFKPEDNKEFDIGKIAGIYMGLYQFAREVNETVIFDRSHITEIAYSHRRGYLSRDYVNWKKVEQELLPEALLIYLTAPVETIKKRFISENETYIEAREIEIILEQFDDYLKHTTLPYLRLDSTKSKEEILKETIIWISQKSKT